MAKTSLELAVEAMGRCRLIAGCTEVAGETTRTFLSEPMREVHRLVGAWMRVAGMRVWVDAAGNVRGVSRASGPEEGPRLVIASHLDTVPNAGAFDGVLGVMLGIALVEAVGAALPFAVEVIGFSEEEGVRFGKPFLGSMAVVGLLDDAVLRLTDGNGVTVAEEIQEFGLDPARLDEARLAAGVFGYLEMHIEQGPVLDSMGRALGVVSALVGQTRMEFSFTGQANHAGTTPMVLRRDALAAAAEWVVAGEAIAQATAGLVATVGRLEVAPGVGNVVPGRVVASLDVRHADDALRSAAIRSTEAAARAAGERRRVGVECRTLLDQAAVRLDAALTGKLADAAARAGFPAERMTSGAGHDAMIVASHVPAAMLFLRSPGGVSHHPDEAVLVEDVLAAIEVGVEFLRGLAEGRG